MPPNPNITFHLGLVTSRDPSTLQNGELAVATGCEYREGSPHIFKQPGRAIAGGSWNSAGIGPIIELHRLQYDVGADVFLIYVRSEVDTNKVRIMETTPFTTAAAAATLVEVLKPEDDLDELPSTPPSFASIQNHWIMVDGLSRNAIREPFPLITGPTVGSNWRQLGMLKPTGIINIANIDLTAPPPGEEPIFPTVGTFSPPAVNGLATGHQWYYPANALNIDEVDYSYAFLLAYAECNTNFPNSYQPFINYAFNAELDDLTNRSIRIRSSVSGDINYYSATALESHTDINEGNLGIELEINVTDGANFTVTLSKTGGYEFKYDIIPVPDDVDLTNVVVTTTLRQVAAPQAPLGFTFSWANVTGAISVLLADNGSSVAGFTVPEDMQYGFTETYTDRNGVDHESVLSELAVVSKQLDGNNDPVTVYGIQLINLPSFFPNVNDPPDGEPPRDVLPTNEWTTKYTIYRTLSDVASNKYPFLYQIGDVTLDVTNSTAVFTDIGDFDTIDIADQGNPYQYLPVLYPDGATLSIDQNTQPPVAKKVVPFQGSMVYLPPVSTKLYYSIPATIDKSAAEKVPSFYFLEFTTPFNDVISTMAVTNSGRIMLAYFQRYTMMVNFLPQATDPGVFDQRVTEYVSNIRGCSGVHAVTEVTIDKGRTFTVAADALGVWSTDGVSEIIEWSNGIAWQDLMANTDMAGIRLYNNALMDRVEILYDSDKDNPNTDLREIHMYYGRYKQDIERHFSPLVTGPHNASVDAMSGYRSKHYAVVDGKWAGWVGSNNNATGTGVVFVDREGAADDSMANDGSTTNVPFVIRTGDIYVNNIGHASLINFGYLKFEDDGTSPTFSLTGRFKRDGASEEAIKSKSFEANRQKKVYWHMYCDRHSLEIRWVTPLAFPGVVAYEFETRDSGVGRDK